MARIRTLKEMWLERGLAATVPVFTLYCVAERGSEQTGPCKIGIATHPWSRLSALQGGNFRPLTMVWQVRMAGREQARDVEQWCLMRFRPNCYSVGGVTTRLASEWVDQTPWTVLQAAVDHINLVEPGVERVA
jgi:hypothetical protein